MKKIISTLSFLLIFQCFMYAQTYNVTSPDGSIKATIEVDDAITYEVAKGEQVLITPSVIDMVVNDDQNLGKDAKVRNVENNEVSETIKPVVQQKYAEIEDHYNELILEFRGRYALNFRAYDDGVAYRWETNFKNELKVNAETVNFNFAEDHKIWFPEEESIYSHQERAYPYINLSEIDSERFCSTPTLVDLGDNQKVLITEADLMDYPGMFLQGSGEYGLKGKYAGVALETEQTSDRDVKVTKYADYLAQTDGTRTFPWRVMIITDNDGELIESEMVYKLAKPLALDDVSWIKPGKVSWDWWNANNIHDVDFKSGVNTETYKYYIDFASKYNIPYIILDEGWYHLDDVMKVKEEVDVEELTEYGRSKNVDLILWVTWKALDDKLDEALAQFEEWGIKGIKVDFMQRDDQWMVNYYQRVAEKAADHKLLVDYHGSYKPTGIRRTYPHVITREGLLGMEQTKWSDLVPPEHNVTIPFIRMVAGPMDYTPGAMINATQQNFRSVFTKPMSLGTRCHQLAMYVVFESPLQMLADNPTHYYEEPECMEFLEAVPTVWDDTKVLHGKVGDYVAIARRSGDTWYLGAMADWDKRSLDIKLDFLGDGEHKIEIWLDGINADRYAEDFKKVEQNVNADSQLTIDMAPGGGWAAIIQKQ